MKLLLPAAIAAYCLLGCQSSPPLKVDSGEVATLDLVELSNPNSVYGYLSVSQDDYDCYGFNPGGTKTSDMPTSKSYSMAGRRFLTLGLTYFEGKLLGPIAESKTCQPRFTFPVRAGARYRVEVAHQGDGCTAAVFEMQAGSKTPISLETREQAPRPLMDSHGPWCKADARFRGSSSYLTPR
jgi:hypothetical protein